MGLKLKITSNHKSVESALKKEKDLYRKGLKLTMFRALSILEAQIVSNIGSKFTTRSGRLINSIPKSKTVVEKGDTITGTIGPEGVPYAAIHEFGGIIRPKSKKALTIPLPAIMGSSGEARVTAGELIGTGTTFIRKGIIFQKQGGKKIIPIFILKDQVKIRARPYLRPAFNSSRKKLIDKFGLHIRATFKTKGKK